MKTFIPKNILKFGLIVISLIFTLVLVQTTSAFAGTIYGKCGHIYDDGKDDGWCRYSVRDIHLGMYSNVDSKELTNAGNYGFDSDYRHGYNAIATTNDYDFGNDSQYNFSDDDGHYDINRLSLACEELYSDVGYDPHEKGAYALALVYDTDTWDWDINGESFHITGAIYVDGHQKWDINTWWEDRSDSGSYDHQFIWQIDLNKFKDEFGCSMQEAIKKGLIDVQLFDIECRSYNQHDDHWARFNLKHLKLDDTSVSYDGGSNSIINGCTNAKGDGISYNFSDEIDETYRIFNLNLQAYTYDNGNSNDRKEQIRFTYHTDTPSWDIGEDFKCSMTIYVDGCEYKKINVSEWTDHADDGESEDSILAWSYDTDKFVSEVGCSLGEGILSGRIVVQMNELSCDPC